MPRPKSRLFLIPSSSQNTQNCTTDPVLTQRLDSLQLNIGIIAACASFLKPLLGRLLKLNSTAASYPTYTKYARSYRATPAGSKYASGSRRTGSASPHDDFESQYRDNILALEREASPHAVPVVSGGGMPGCYKQQPPDVDSDDIQLLPLEPARGIVRTREYSVKYSER